MNIEVTRDSPYVNGTIVVYEDGTYSLDPPDNPLKYHNNSGEDKTHQIRQGDTLESLSRLYYKNSAEWHQLLNYNPWIWDYENLPVGENLLIPNPIKFRT